LKLLAVVVVLAVSPQVPTTYRRVQVAVVLVRMQPNISLLRPLLHIHTLSALVALLGLPLLPMAELAEAQHSLLWFLEFPQQ
jgi:hypothetical protein